MKIRKRAINAKAPMETAVASRPAHVAGENSDNWMLAVKSIMFVENQERFLTLSFQAAQPTSRSTP